MITSDPPAVRLSEMSACAYRLGMAFGAEAEQAEDVARKIEWFELFERCFFSVRVATALELRLRREARLGREAESDREELIDRADPQEREGEREDRDRGYDERDRDREGDVERASLPVLLRTLEGVVADAAALPDVEPAALLTLRELLAQAKSEPAAAAPAASLRSRLAGSGAATALAPRPPPDFGAGRTVRRATGPPAR